MARVERLAHLWLLWGLGMLELYYIGIMEKKMETTTLYWGYMGSIGIMEKKMETTVVYWGTIGVMETKMETTVVYWGTIGGMEKKNGNYYSIQRVLPFG